MSRTFAAVILLALAAAAAWRAFAPEADAPAPPGPPHTDAAASVEPGASGDPAAAPNKAPEFVLHGRVVAGDGAPVAGLPVGALPRPNGLGGPLPDTGRFQARTETRADGTFELHSAVATTLWVGPLHGPGLPAFLAPPVAVRFGPAPEPETSREAPLVFAAVPARTLRGSVRLDRAEGVRPADVRVLVIGQRTGHSGTGSIDAEGQVRLALLHDEPYLCVAVAAAHVSEPALAVPTSDGPTLEGPTGDQFELVLEPVAALRVEVEGGDPPGLRVECMALATHPVELARLAIAGRAPNFLLDRPYALAVFTTERFGYVPSADPGPASAPPTVSVALAPAAQLEVANTSDAPRIVVVEQAGRVVRAQSLALTGRMVLTVPPGDLRVHVHDLLGAELAQHAVALAAGARAALEIR